MPLTMRVRGDRVGRARLARGGRAQGAERALTAAFPRASFRPIPEAGHFPHMEQPEAVFAAIGDFMDAEVKSGGE